MDIQRSDSPAPDSGPQRPASPAWIGPVWWNGKPCGNSDSDWPDACKPEPEPDLGLNAPGGADNDPDAAPPSPPRALSVRDDPDAHGEADDAQYDDEPYDEEPEEAWMRDDYDRLLDFEPVPRKNNVIRGWTPKKQRGFIAALRASGSVQLSTAEVGMGYEGVYKLRHAPGAEGFARAWDEAVAIGARRVRDVFIDQNIHGIPERVVIGKDIVVERRRFNHRSMMWVLQHHLPHDYPGGSTTQRGGWARGANRGSGRSRAWRRCRRRSCARWRRSAGTRCARSPPIRRSAPRGSC